MQASRWGVYRKELHALCTLMTSKQTFTRITELVVIAILVAAIVLLLGRMWPEPVEAATPERVIVLVPYDVCGYGCPTEEAAAPPVIVEEPTHSQRVIVTGTPEPKPTKPEPTPTAPTKTGPTPKPKPTNTPVVQTRPGHGYGDKNHVHTGPPGQNKPKKNK